MGYISHYFKSAEPIYAPNALHQIVTEFTTVPAGTS